MARNTLLLATRKGLMILNRTKAGFELKHEAFLGVPVNYVYKHPQRGTLWACLDHGHWGQKLHRSEDHGRTWEELDAPKYQKV